MSDNNYAEHILAKLQAGRMREAEAYASKRAPIRREPGKTELATAPPKFDDLNRGPLYWLIMAHLKNRGTVR